MKIKDVLYSKGRTGFYFDDQEAIREGVQLDGFIYKGQTVTDGFSSVRIPGESISVMLVLENGEVAFGDCVAVQYSGIGGRDPLFLADEFMPLIENMVKPHLVGQELDSFRRLAKEIEDIKWEEDGEVKRLHTAIRYGVTQAILDGVARTKKKTMAEVIVEEYNLEIVAEPVHIFTQSGDDRYINADKMILKQVSGLPHALINNVKTKLGENGEILLDYARWLKDRVEKVRQDEDYFPTFHFDVYGTFGLAFNKDPEKIVDYIALLEKTVAPYKLQIEGPVDMGNRELQIKTLQEILRLIDKKGLSVKIIADEWCNTLEDIMDFAKAGAGHIIQVKTPDLGGIQNSIEAILYCKSHGVGAYMGGSCNETDRSAQVCVHVALATQPMQLLAKPGMGVDEGYMIMHNEMMRTLQLLKKKV